MRPIQGLPGYMITDAGWVISPFGFALKSHVNVNNGYDQISIGRKRNKTVRVHRLVANAFLPPREPGQRGLIHVDGNKRNNSASNLRWATQAEIMTACVARGGQARGARQALCKLSEDDVIQIRRKSARGMTDTELARVYHVSRRTINDVVSRRGWGWLKDKWRPDGREAERSGAQCGAMESIEGLRDAV